jgi:hypothetical protein
MWKGGGILITELGWLHWMKFENCEKGIFTISLDNIPLQIPVVKIGRIKLHT